MTSVTGRPSPASGFTLVEIVVTLTILAIITGALTPSIKGVIREHQAREPLREVISMAREVRARAVRMGRPYQIGFDSQGCFASAYYQPYQVAGEYEALKIELEQRRLEREIIEASQARFGIEEETILPQDEHDDEFLIRYEWPDNLQVQVKYWGETDWKPLLGMETERWIFLPTGMCKPLTLQMENEGVFIEVRFTTLTADVEEEISYVE